MCGRFNVIDDPKVRVLLDIVGVKLEPHHYRRDIAPGSDIAIVKADAQGRSVATATWWLLLDRETLKPNYKYASFNSRSDKLNQPRAISYVPFRKSRCLIPASAFVEGLGDKKTYYKIEFENRAIAFGGLFKTYLNGETGEQVYSASIITLPPIPAWQDIHLKSVPLMLDVEDGESVNKWLDPDFTDVERFKDLLVPHIHWPRRVTPIDKPSKWNPIGESFMVT